MAADVMSSLSRSNIFYTVFGFLCATSTIFGLERVTQETTDSRSLYPFRSFRDVQLFHFLVPHQTTIASFYFKSNATSGCDAKQVAVHLQFGGYPLANPENTTFPPHMIVDRISSEAVTFPSDGETTLNISMPLQGDWFAVAYLNEDTNRIVQKGIFQNCRVSITITARYHIDENVTHLPPNVVYLYNETQHYSGTNQQKFRFFAPENTWSASITVSQCTSVVPDAKRSCPIILMSRTKGLPSMDTNDAMVNCSTPVSECSLKMIPAEDAWSYIEVYFLDTSLSAFEITVQIEECQQDMQDLGVEDTLQSVPVIPFKLMRLLARKEANIIPNEETEKESHKLHSVPSSVSPVAQSCWNKNPLMRKNTPGNFAFDFVLYHNNSASRRVNLTSDSVSFFKFPILPTGDSGGTLSVLVRLSSEMNTNASNISVVGCLRYGVHPETECPKEWMVNVNTSSEDNHAYTIMIPYPEIGPWYLSLQPVCYVIQTLANNESFPEKVRCTDNETEITFHISSAPCVLGHCGDYGSCHQYISGGFIFSTCICEAGWRGYGCTDDREALSNAELLLAIILLTLSNVLFVPAIVLAIYRRLFTEAFVYMATMLSSTLYHACDCEVYSVCVLKLSTLQFCDFFSAILSVWVTLIAMAKLPVTLQSLAHMIGAVGVALGVEYDRTGLFIFLIPAMFALSILVISWVRFCKRQHECYPNRRTWLLCILPGILIAAVGLILYAFLETKRNYQFVHSGWHAAMALSILFLLPERINLKGEVARVQDIATTSYVPMEEHSDSNSCLD